MRRSAIDPAGFPMPPSRTTVVEVVPWTQPFVFPALQSSLYGTAAMAAVAIQVRPKAVPVTAKRRAQDSIPILMMNVPLQL